MSFGKWRKGTVIAAACGIVCLLVVGLLFANRESRASGLTLEEARSEVLKQYGGEIVSSTAGDGGYQLTLKTDQGLYEVTVGGQSAEVSGIRLVERYVDEEGAEGSSSPDVSPSTDNGNASSPTPTPTTSPSGTPAPPSQTPSATEQPSTSIHITAEKAKSLALAKVAGIVTDVEKDDDDGIWYYYVDIETKDGREAEVQLNAASGSIVSVAWDEEDDDDDGDD